jgi:hypothetical protein
MYVGRRFLLSLQFLSSNSKHQYMNSLGQRGREKSIFASDKKFITSNIFTILPFWSVNIIRKISPHTQDSKIHST